MSRTFGVLLIMAPCLLGIGLFIGVSVAQTISWLRSIKQDEDL